MRIICLESGVEEGTGVVFSFVRIAKLFFRMAMPFYIPISNV